VLDLNRLETVKGANSFLLRTFLNVELGDHALGVVNATVLLASIPTTLYFDCNL
jgi:hypothetical protein